MHIISSYSFRPTRKLYYMNATQEDIDNFYHGVMPEKIMQYEGAFGTYGHPGLFLIKDAHTTLNGIGIEYRQDDDRISYPEGLLDITLLPTVFRLDLMFDDGDKEINDETVRNHIDLICKSEKEKYYHIGGICTAKENPEIIQVFSVNDQIRVLIEAELSPDDTTALQEDESSKYKHMYYHDYITGYYNWNYLWPRIAWFHNYGVQDYSFVFFDIKDFKAINVIYGHLVANQLLTDITNLMEKTDWIYFSARCDNDNFAMMIKDMPEAETREKLYEFFDSISYLDADKNYRIYYRCGIVPMRTTIEMGDRVADAGKQAKAFGTKPYKTELIFFTDEMNDKQNRAIQLRSYLDTAIARDEFMVYLQPKYDIKTEKIKGAEALIRWKYMGKNILSPGIFIPLFEEDGLITKLDDIVLKKVCIKLKEWEKQGKPLYPISVNVSRKSIGIPGLVEHLTEIVDSFGVDHSLIDFELTESAMYDNQDTMIKIIEKLKHQGFKLSMDDFGTGYSSLSLLPIMPFDTLKIDKSFVDRIGKSNEYTKSCAVVKQIIALAKDLNMRCLAEGAENKEQVDLLRDFGCEIVQGYYYSKPLPVEEYEKLL